MKTKKLLPLLLILSLLLGCTPTPAPPPPEPVVEVPEPVPGPPPEPELPEPPPVTLPWPVYLYTSGSRSLAVNDGGEVVLEVSDGELRLLNDGNGRPAAIAHCFFGDLETWEDGTVVARDHWMDVYDLEGTLRMEHVPGDYGVIWGDVLSVHWNGCLYRLSDGQLLYEDVFTAYDLGETIFVRPSSEGPGGFLLDREGNFLKDLPPETGAEHGYVLDGTGYLETRFADGRQGLLDAWGEPLLEPLNDVVGQIRGDKIVVTRDGTEQILDLHTGEVLASLPGYSSLYLYPQAIVGSFRETDPQGSGWRADLLDYQGNRLLEQHFDSLEWADGIFLGETEAKGRQRVTAYRPDGTELWSLDMLVTYFGVIGRWGLYAENGPNHGLYYNRVDLQTGEKLRLNEEPCSHNSEPPWYWSGRIPYVLLLDDNALGWERGRLVSLETGEAVAEGLRECQYIGGEVFQCRKGFDRGLMRLDGTWLYKERAFDGWNED